MGEGKEVGKQWWLAVAVLLLVGILVIRWFDYSWVITLICWGAAGACYRFGQREVSKTAKQA